VASPVQLRDEDQDTNQQMGGSSVHGKEMTSRASMIWSLSEVPQKLNPVLQGWNDNRFCARGKPSVRCGRLLCQELHLALANEEAWETPPQMDPVGATFEFRPTRRERFRRGWMRTLACIGVPREPMHNERCMSGSEGGHQNPTVTIMHGADALTTLTLGPSV
jgi:hypothetical protein